MEEQSWNRSGWKRPLRPSSSPAVNLALPSPPLNHVPVCIQQWSCLRLVGTWDGSCLFPVQTDAWQCEHYFFSPPIQSRLKSSRKQGTKIKGFLSGNFPCFLGGYWAILQVVWLPGRLGSNTKLRTRLKWQWNLAKGSLVTSVLHLTVSIGSSQCLSKLIGKKNTKPEAESTNKNNFCKGWSRGDV